MIEFTVPAVPVAQPRQRHRVVRSGGRTYASNYTPAQHPVNAFKGAVAASFRAAYQGPPLEGPLSLRVTFVMPRPKSMRWKTKPTPREPYVASRNDWDNLGKSVGDSLNKIAFHDDGQIAIAHVERWIAAGDEQPHVLIQIAEIEKKA